MKRRTAILISGRGSNMAALVAAARAPDYPAEIALVLANRGDAAGLHHPALRDPGSRGAGVPTAVVEHRRFGPDRAAHEAAIAAELDAAGVDIVCLAGYLRLLTPFLVGRYAGRMLNIHPSLLPAFSGWDPHAVPVLADDTVESLAARVLVQEHLLYPMALRLFARGEPGDAPPGHAALRNPLPRAAPVT